MANIKQMNIKGAIYDIMDKTAVHEGDARLTDARTPLPHTHVEADITNLQDYSLNGHTHLKKDITDLTAVYTYKGTVQHESDLPMTGNIVGDVYNVNDTSMNYAWDGIEWDALGDTTAIPNSDWEENDPTKTEYVENRTHWKETSTQTEIIPLPTIFNNWTFDGDSTYTITGMDDYINTLRNNTIYLSSRLNSNNITNITISPISSSSTFTDLGNNYRLYFNIEPTTAGEVQLILKIYDATTSTETAMTSALAKEFIENLSLSYIHDVITYHALDINYIPLDIQANWDQNNSTSWDYVENRTHYTDADGVIHTLDSKYLEDKIVKGATTQSDWSENDENEISYIKNRTHYVEKALVERELSLNVINEAHLSHTYNGSTGAITKLCLDLPYSDFNIGDTITITTTNGDYTYIFDNAHYIVDDSTAIVVKQFQQDYAIPWEEPGQTALDFTGTITITHNSDNNYSLAAYTTCSLPDTHSLLTITESNYSSYSTNPLFNNDFIITYKSNTNKENIYHQLDSRYLPDSLYDNLKNIEKEAETHSDWAENDSTEISYIENRTHYIAPILVERELLLSRQNNNAALALNPCYGGIVDLYLDLPYNDFNIGDSITITTSNGDYTYTFDNTNYTVDDTSSPGIITKTFNESFDIPWNEETWGTANVSFNGSIYLQNSSDNTYTIFDENSSPPVGSSKTITLDENHSLLSISEYNYYQSSRTDDYDPLFNHNFTITYKSNTNTEDKYYQLDERYLPDSLYQKLDDINESLNIVDKKAETQSNWNENNENELSYIQNRTHYKETITNTYDIPLTYLMSSSGDYLYTMTIPDGLDIDSLENISIKVNDDDAYTCTKITNTNYIQFNTEATVSGYSNPMYYFSHNTITDSYTFTVPNGSPYTGASAVTSLQILVPTEVIHTLDPDYIPDNGEGIGYTYQPEDVTIEFTEDVKASYKATQWDSKFVSSTSENNVYQYEYSQSTTFDDIDFSKPIIISYNGNDYPITFTKYEGTNPYILYSYSVDIDNVLYLYGTYGVAAVVWTQDDIYIFDIYLAKDVYDSSADKPKITYTPLPSIHQIDKKYISNNIQSDWAENDDESINYVQNRTHWSEGTAEEKIITLQNPSSEYYAEAWGGIYSSDTSENNTFYFQTNITTFDIDINYPLIITYNDIDYTVFLDMLNGTSFLNAYQYNFEIPYPSNQSNKISVYTITPREGLNIVDIILSKDIYDSSINTLTLTYTTKEDIYELDHKYIPDNGAGIGYTGTCEHTIQFINKYFDYWTSTGNWIDNTDANSASPNTYSYWQNCNYFINASYPIKIIYNNKTYHMMVTEGGTNYYAYNSGEDGWIYGDTGIAIEFYTYDNEPWTEIYFAPNIYNANAEPPILTFTANNAIHQIEEKYLPLSIQSDWNENDKTSLQYIPNRTHYTVNSMTETITLNYDWSYYNSSNWADVKTYSDTTKNTFYYSNERDNCVRKIDCSKPVILTYGNNTYTFTLTDFDYTYGDDYYSGGIYNIDPDTWICYYGTNGIAIMFNTSEEDDSTYAYVYFEKDVYDSSIDSLTLTYTTIDDIHKLDNKYLNIDVAHINNYIPIIATNITYGGES